MSGIDFNLESDEEILKINSPKNFLGGPYLVVFKSLQERWAIVAITWESAPRLAIRWFWEAKGNPISRNYPTWFTLPVTLDNAVLNGLPLEFKFRDILNRFLAGTINSDQLQQEYSKL